MILWSSFKYWSLKMPETSLKKGFVNPVWVGQVSFWMCCHITMSVTWRHHKSSRLIGLCPNRAAVSLRSVIRLEQLQGDSDRKQKERIQSWPSTRASSQETFSDLAAPLKSATVRRKCGALFAKLADSLCPGHCTVGSVLPLNAWNQSRADVRSYWVASGETNCTQEHFRSCWDLLQEESHQKVDDKTKQTLEQRSEWEAASGPSSFTPTSAALHNLIMILKKVR